MPKGKKTNKSQAIRDLLTARPEMTAKEVLAALSSRGLKVKDSLVYFIKGKMKAKTHRRKRVVRAARAASTNGDPVTLIREVKVLAGRAGGIGKLKELVEAMAE
jgi:hypothetical protein